MKKIQDSDQKMLIKIDDLNKKIDTEMINLEKIEAKKTVRS